MALFLPLMIGGGVAGGALSGLSAAKNNRAVANAANANLQNLAQETKSRGLALLDQQAVLAQNATSRIGSLINATGTTSGSVGAVIRQMIADSARDANAVRAQSDANIQAYQTQSANIVNQARSQTVNPFLATLQGAFQGASLGANLGGAIDQYNSTSAARQALEKAGANYSNDPVGSIATANAIRSGVDASQLNNPAIMNPFIAAAELQQRGLRTSQAQLNAARNLFGGQK